MNRILNVENIPDFLKDSKLYQDFIKNLSKEDIDLSDDEEDENISPQLSIPSKYFIDNLSMKDGVDLQKVLESLRFWMINYVPNELTDFVLKTSDIDYTKIFDNFKDLFFINKIYLLLEVQPDKVLETVIENNNLGLFKYLYHIKWKCYERDICSAVKKGYDEIVIYYIDSYHKGYLEEIKKFFEKTERRDKSDDKRSKDKDIKRSNINDFKHPISDMNITFNHNSRFPQREREDTGPFGDIIDIDPHSIRTTAPGVYTFNMAMTPNNMVPSGHVNFSRIDSADVTFNEKSEINFKHFILEENTIIYQAAINGDLNLLRYAHKNGCDFHGYNSDYASPNIIPDVIRSKVPNYLEIINYLIKYVFVSEQFCVADIDIINRLYNDTKICAAAAEINDIELLKILKEKKFDWDEKVCAFAAKNDNLEMLEYARDNSCKWDFQTYKNALAHSKKCLAYAKRHSCPETDPSVVNLDVFATNYNVFRTMSGLSGIRYSN